jgi:hypothetical protein
VTTVERVTRRPTGLPSWPIVALTGPEKSGKTWAAAEASTSDLVSRTLWVGIGEDDPDEYGVIPGADFEIVPHDGTFRDFLAAVEWACHQPSPDERPTLIVIDSATRLWDLICNDLQIEANARERRKAAKQNRQPDPGDMQITMDMWNIGKDRWGHVIDALREHTGPSLVTARLEVVTVVDGNGNPTRNKDKKIKAEKTLPFDVGAIVEFTEPGKAIVTGARSARLKDAAGENRLQVRQFTVDGLWRALGVHERVSPRVHTPAGHALPTVEGFADELRRATMDRCRAIWREAKQHGMLDQPADEGQTPLGALIEQRVASLQVIEAEAAERAQQEQAQQDGIEVQEPPEIDPRDPWRDSQTGDTTLWAGSPA